ncbi:hypothetical protein BC829DRAFT_399491 [Chytridium lagenaria]|nr:hypothetical protein BC829DRAFT_399491 [Chytridium lagenaria]
MSARDWAWLDNDPHDRASRLRIGDGDQGLHQTGGDGRASRRKLVVGLTSHPQTAVFVQASRQKQAVDPMSRFQTAAFVQSSHHQTLHLPPQNSSHSSQYIQVNHFSPPESTRVLTKFSKSSTTPSVWSVSSSQTVSVAPPPPHPPTYHHPHKTGSSPSYIPSAP